MILTFGSPSYAGRVELLRILARLNAQPFVHQVAQSPWDNLMDVPSLHAEAKERIRQMVDRCEKSGAIRIQTIIGHAGYGKTHLLAWLRQELEDSGKGMLVYVPPYRFAAPDETTFEQHLLQATFQSFWQRGTTHKEQLIHSVQRDLVECYDDMVTSTHSKKEALGLAPGFFSGIFGFNLKIVGKSSERQRKALQEALACAPFLDAIFAAFKSKYPIDADGVQYERDAFASVMLLACGNEKQVDVAERWFLSKATEAELKICHLDGLCRSTNKVRDSLYTIRRLTGQPFCIALDQLEDTYRSLPSSEGSRVFGITLSGIIRDLGLIPGFSVLFMFNVGLWQEFCRVADVWLIDRLTEGKGVCQLQPLDETAAEELIRVRMRGAVWDRLDEKLIPANEPAFPFTSEMIQRMLGESNRELRTFLYRAQTHYEKLLQTELAIELHKVDPDEVWCDEETKVLLSCGNLPSSVRVFIAQTELTVTPTGQAGEIEVTIPRGLTGDVTLRVESSHEPLNAVQIPLKVRLLPLPLVKWIDGKKLQTRFNELKLPKAKTANQIGLSSWQAFNKLMAEQLENASDEVYQKLAEVLEIPLNRLLKMADSPVPNGDLVFGEPLESEASS